MILIVATGQRFIGKGVRSFESVIEELIYSALREIHIAVYTISPSAYHIINLIKNKAEQGVRINILVNSLYNLDAGIKDSLTDLKKSFPEHVRIVNFSDLKKPGEGDFHAKVLVIDRKKALIGSANLSCGGTIRNYEIGVLLEDEVVWYLAALLDEFFIEKPRS